MPTLSTHAHESGHSVHVLDLCRTPGSDETGEGVLTDAFLSSMSEALDEIESSEGPAALVTVGAGKFYSTGLDTELLATGAGTGEYLTRVHSLFARILRLDLPTVAAVNGHAFGAGAMLTLCHDVRIMRTGRGYWNLPEAALGMPFPPAMHSLVTTRLGHPVAAAAMTTSHRYTAEEARDARIVDATAPEDELLDTATARATGLAGMRGPNLRGIREQLVAEVLTSLDAPVT